MNQHDGSKQDIVYHSKPKPDSMLMKDPVGMNQSFVNCNVSFAVLLW